MLECVAQALAPKVRSLPRGVFSSRTATAAGVTVSSEFSKVFSGGCNSKALLTLRQLLPLRYLQTSVFVAAARIAFAFALRHLSPPLSGSWWSPCQYPVRCLGAFVSSTKEQRNRKQTANCRLSCTADCGDERKR